MLKQGALAVAIVQHQVMVVKAVRSHSTNERFLDVCTFTQIGDRLFLATDVPNARISASDMLTLFPFEYGAVRGNHGASSQQQTITLSRPASSITLINENEGRFLDDGHRESITFEMLELPRDAFKAYLELCERNQRMHEKLWAGSTIGKMSRVGAGPNATGPFRRRSSTLRFW